jgi:hypothetical protein
MDLGLHKNKGAKQEYAQYKCTTYPAEKANVRSNRNDD